MKKDREAMRAMIMLLATVLLRMAPKQNRSRPRDLPADAGVQSLQQVKAKPQNIGAFVLLRKPLFTLPD